MTERKKKALAIWIGKGLVVTAFWAAFIWFFGVATPDAIDKALEVQEARTAAHLSWLEQERMHK